MQHVVDLMQEAALVLAPVVNELQPSVVVDYRAEMVNKSAADVLGSDQVVGQRLAQFLPEDTAALLRKLCDETRQSGAGVGHVAAAPDPLTDLARAPSVSLRVALVGDLVLCTWLPGWLTPAGAGERPPITSDGESTADHLELANAVDALADAGVGVFSLDLMTGRLIGSRGLRRIFGPGSDAQSGLEAAVADDGAWQALLRRGEPMDVEVKLSSRLGGHRVRVVGRVGYAADGHPAVVRGSCSVLHT
ncbi:hypothetical protein FKR81_08755 [Lentzea tibetensis]|uniref:Uncharacterized protein n=1 Tax=Lentzea tibetensis TaxID=2591470 RepID=A0A563EXF7_9PSEU|nr:hypothetical protein [Lentzea tibetensis]TWP52417.1 hypothetical protein FKR81_08755 [Lentzea tibetensis]